MGEETRADTGHGFGRTLLLLTLLGLAARVLYLLLEPHCERVGDEPSWLALGLLELGRPNKGLDPFRVRLIFYPPVYPYSIAILNRVFGTPEAVLWLQTLAGALLVPAVGLVGRLASAPRVGLVAAAFAAFYPELLWYPAHYWSETFYLALLWWAIERTLAADARRSRGVAAAAGFLWGLSCLTRELSLYLVPLVVLWLARAPVLGWWRARRAPTGAADRQPSRPAVARAAILAFTTVLVVAPWTIRNAIVYRAFIPVSTMGGLNLWQGNTRLTHLQIYDVLHRIDGAVEQDRYSQRQAWREIRAQQPRWIFDKLAKQMPEFWRAGSEVVDHFVGREACGALAPRTVIALEVLFVGAYLLVLVPALYGLARVRVTHGGLLLLVLLAAYNAAHVVSYATTRFRLPMMPVLFLLAAAAVSGSGTGVLHPTSRRRSLLLAGLALLALATLYPGMGELESWRRLFGAR